MEGSAGDQDTAAGGLYCCSAHGDRVVCNSRFPLTTDPITMARTASVFSVYCPDLRGCSNISRILLPVPPPGFLCPTIAIPVSGCTDITPYRATSVLLLVSSIYLWVNIYSELLKVQFDKC